MQLYQNTSYNIEKNKYTQNDMILPNYIHYNGIGSYNHSTCLFNAAVIFCPLTYDYIKK
jgi:hypothetical protein